MAGEGASEGKAWGLCRMPCWSDSSPEPAALAPQQRRSGRSQVGQVDRGASARQRQGGGGSVSSLSRTLLPTPRRLRLDPSSKLYFPYEPGKQVKSAIRIKNTSKSLVAFKFQTTAPKSCFMRPPGAILSPGESIIATVFKFVEQPENNEKPQDQKNKVKFKIMSLKVKEPTEYVPELFDEQKDQVSVERILRVVFLDADHPSPQLEKLKRQLAEAETALEARKKPSEDTGPRIVGEGLVIDEWKERRERYLAKQQMYITRTSSVFHPTGFQRLIGRLADLCLGRRQIRRWTPVECKTLEIVEAFHPNPSYKLLKTTSSS